MDNAMFIDDAFHRAPKKSQLRPGDLAIVRTGYPGTAAVIPLDLPDSNCSDLVIVRPTKEANPHFLCRVFQFGIRKAARPRQNRRCGPEALQHNCG